MLNDQEIKKIETKLNKQKETAAGLVKSKAYTVIKNLKSKFENAKTNNELKKNNEKFYSVEDIDDKKSIKTESIVENIEKANYAISLFSHKIQDNQALVIIWLG